MPAAEHAVLEHDGGRAVLRFERSLAHPPERVWRALTNREELNDWHPTPLELEPAAGGQVRYVPAEQAPEMPVGTVLEYEPPRLLAYTWGEDELRWELEPYKDGCVLRLAHTFDDRFKAARDAAGWTLCLESLSYSLEGTANPQLGHGERLPGGWREINAFYEERFGISPKEATPPPKQ
jgi:uncharacterized protein YndB with AHSA1/START domain